MTQAHCGTSHCDGSMSARACDSPFRVAFTNPSLRLAHLGGAATRRNAGHAKGEAERRKNVLDLVERLATEVLRREHLALGALNEVTEGADVGVLEAVGGTDGEVELFDGLDQHLRQARVDFRRGSLFDLLALRLERAEDAQ